jgi:hypothetical protein
MLSEVRNPLLAKELIPLARNIFLHRVNWQGRATRGATDPFNALLNYGQGSLHADQPDKPSLTLERVTVINGMRSIAKSGSLHKSIPVIDSG